MVRFAHPEYLYFLGLLPVLIVVLFWHYRVREKKLAAIGDVELVRRLTESFSSTSWWFRQSLLLTALALLIVAAAGLEVGTRYEEVTLEGIDLVIALDVSASMHAEDVQPNRLEKAKHAINTLLGRLGGDRVALVVFAGGAFIQCPMTSDYAAIRMLLDAADVSSITSGGSNLGGALEKAAQAFPRAVAETQPADKAIVLFSDGEDHEPDYDAVVDQLKEERVRVFAIGIGTDAGVPIPLYDEQGRVLDFKKNEGNVVTTRREETHLRKIAENTNGQYFGISANESEIDKLYRSIAGMEKGGSKQFQFTSFENRFQYFVGLAILLLSAEFSLKRRRHARH